MADLVGMVAHKKRLKINNNNIYTKEAGETRLPYPDTLRSVEMRKTNPPQG